MGFDYKEVDNYESIMKYADIIFTTSFHGTAFSTIFHKNFWYIDSGKNDLNKDDSAVSFLTQLGLLDRYKTIGYLKSNEPNVAPDFNQVDLRLNEMKEKSMEYLRSIVNE